MLEEVSPLRLFEVNQFVHLKCLSFNWRMKSFELFPSPINFPCNAFQKDWENELLKRIHILICLICVVKEHTQHFQPVYCKLECVIQQLPWQTLFHMWDKGIENIFTSCLLYFPIIFWYTFSKQINLCPNLKIQTHMTITN